MEILKNLNLGLSFLVELAMLYGLGYFSVKQFDSALGLIIPVLVAVLWGLLAAPKAARRLPYPALGILKAALFTLTALAIYIAGAHVWAVIFAVISLANLTLASLWHQDIKRS